MQSLALFTLVILSYIVPSGNDHRIAWPVIALFYIYMFRVLLSPVMIVDGIKCYVTAESTFFLFYFLLFIHPYQQHLLGMVDLSVNSYMEYAYINQGNTAILATGVGFVAFHLGRTLMFVSPRPLIDRASLTFRDTRYSLFGYYILALIILFFSIYTGSGLVSADEGRYSSSSYGGAVADGIYLIIAMLCMIAISRFVAIVAGKQKLDIGTVICLIFVMYWSMRILINGDRNNFFLISVVAVAGFSTYIKSVRMPMLITMVLAALVVYNAIEIVRMAQDRGIEAVVEAVLSGEDSQVERDSSFTITTATLRAAFDIVPAREDFGYGWYKVIGIAGIIPLIRGFAFADTSHYFSTAEVLSHYMLGASASWSVGTNVLSDTYMDFGILGLPIMLLFIGAFAGKVERWASAEGFSTKAIAIYLIVLASFSQLPRYAVDQPVRIVVWTLVIFVFFEIFARDRNRKDHTRRAKENV